MLNKLPFELELARREILIRKKSRIMEFRQRTGSELVNYGIINLDKPKGPKSIHVCNKIREILEQPKLGHAGTLDPAVTGVLPVGLGKAVKILRDLSLAGKVYEGKMHLHADVEKEKLLDAVKKFIGKIIQTPPSKSAVARRPREREVYWFKIKKISGRDAAFEIGCEHGTYIRTVCVDLGKYLGCGAHMAELRRLQAGPLKIKDSIKLDEVRELYGKFVETKKENYLEKFIIQPEEIAKHLPSVWVDINARERIKQGSPVFAPGIVQLTSEIKKGDVVAIFGTDGALWGLGNAELSADEMLKAEKGLAVKTDVVLIS